MRRDDILSMCNTMNRMQGAREDRRDFSAPLRRHIPGSPFLRFFVLYAVLLLTLPVPQMVHAAGGDVIAPFPVIDARAGKQVAERMAVDSQGNVIMTGHHNAGGANNNYHTVKFKADGSGPAWPPASYDRAGSDDQALAVAVDANNDIIVTGYAWNGQHYDVHTIKYDGATGAVLWQQTFNGAANGNDFGTTIAVDGSNNVYIGGYTYVSSDNDDYLILKYKNNADRTLSVDGTFGTNGVVTWNGAANGNDRITSIAAGTDFIVATGGSRSGTGFDFMTRKYDLNGTFVRAWTHTSPGVNDDWPQIVKIAAAGNVVVTGYTSSGTNRDIYTVKYDGATGAVLWQRPYDGGYDDEPRGLWIDSAGDVYVTGYTWTLIGRYEFYTARYGAADGAVLWWKSFGSGGDNDDVAIPTGIVVSDDVFVTGYTYKLNSGDYDFQTLKYKRDNGNELWQRSFNGVAGKDDIPSGIGFDPSGEVFVAGWTDSWTAGASDYDYIVIKYDQGLLNAPTNLAAETVSATEIRLTWTDNSANEDGFKIERKIGEHGTYSQIDSIASNPTSTVVYHDTTGLSPNTKYYYQVRAFNAANGDTHYSNEAHALTTVVPYAAPSWSYTYNGPGNNDDFATAIAVGPDNHPVVTGFSYNNEAQPSFDYYTLKFNRANGALIWPARYNGDQDETDVAVGVAVDLNNTVVVTGYSSFYSPAVGQNTNDIYTIKYPSAGPPESWSAVYNGPTSNDDRSSAVATATDASNNIVVVGFGKNGVLPALGNDDIYVIKYLANGTRAWAATPYDGGGNDHPAAVVFDQAGNIFMTGYTHNGSNYDIITRKYNGSDGSVIWTDIFDGGFGDDAPKAIAVDGAGNIYVAGYTTNAAGNLDFYAIKYNGADVADPRRIWERSHDGPAHGNDEAVSVKVDPIDGEIVVSGTSLTATGNNDYHIIRYTPNLGIVQWERTLPRPSNDDHVMGVAMDVSGNVCVAGNTTSGSGTDILSVKYNYEGAITGATVFNGAANSYDYASAVAINSLGEAFIAGYSRNAAGNDDYVVFKCAWDTLQAPAPFTAAPSYTSVTLNWSDNSTTENGYYVERKDGACSPGNTNPWELIHTALPNASNFTDAGRAINATYCYRVQAYQNNGEASRWLETTATTIVPAKPTGLTATTANTTQINLSWTDNTDPETGFIIERCIGASCEYPPTAPAAAGKGTVSHQDAGVCQNTSYTYRVKAYKTGEWETDYSDPATRSSQSAGASPVLTAARISEAQINLSWTDTTADETGYEVWRKAEACGSSALSFGKTANMPVNDEFNTGIDPALWNQRGVLNTTSTTPPIDMTDVSGQARITAAQGTVELYTKTNGGAAAGSYNSSEIIQNNMNGFLAGNFDVQIDFTLPDGQITSSQHNAYARLRVNFPDSAGGANYVSLERTVTSAGNGYSTYTSLNGVANSFTAVNLNHTTGKLRISRSGGTITTSYWTGSAWQSHATITITLAASDVRIGQHAQRNNAVTLRAVIDNFKVVTGNIAFSDTGLSPSTTYCYKVKAFKNASCRWEVESNAAGQTTTISAPSGLTATAASTTQINLSWTRNTATEEGFIVERCLGAGCTAFAQVPGPTPTVGAGVTSYNDTDVCADSTYRYQVRAYHAGWTPTTSDPSTAATTVTPAIANVLLNPGFESDFTNWTTAVGTTTGTSIDTAVIYDGAKSLKIQTTTAAALGRSQAVSVSPGRQYTLSGYLRANLTAGQVQCDVQGTGIDSPGIKIVNNDANDNDTWVFLSETVTIPAGTTSVNVRCFGDISPRGPANFDKIRFVPAPLVSLNAARVSEAEIMLAWTDVTTDETGYTIERCRSGPVCVEIPIGPNSGTVTYYDGGLDPSTVYTYRVKAYKTATCGWETPWSNVESPETTIPPLTLSASPADTTTTGLAWNDDTAYESEAIVERCTGSGCGDFAEVGRSYRDVTNMLLLRMDEQAWSGAGLRDVVDLSGYGRHGYSYNGAATVAGGKIGRAGSFDGSNDYIVTPLDGTTLREFTIEFWLKPSSTPGSGSIFRWTNDLNAYYSFVDVQRVSTAAPNTTVRWQTGSIWASGLIDLTIPVNDWTHLALTYDGTTWRAYKNGVLAGTSTAARSSQNYASSVYLGGGYYSYSGGYLDEFAIYGRTLPETEVLARVQKPGLKNYTDATACENATYTYRVKTIKNMSNSGGDCWTRKAPLTISSFRPNYQARLVIPYDADMQADFDDIRFYDLATDAELPYWIETKTDGASATVWFRTGMSNSIVLYYGNASALSSSSGERVFEAFDDFNDGSIGSLWTMLGGNGSISENGGNVNFSYTGSESNNWGGADRQGKALRLTNLPLGDFQAQIKLNSYTVNDLSHAGISVYGSDGAAYMWGRYRSGATPNTRLDKVNPTLSNVSSHASTDLPVYLATRRIGALHSFALSANNSTWTSVGSSYSDVAFNNLVLFGKEWGTGTSHNLAYSMDDFYIRKYVTPEPTVTLGAEAQDACYGFTAWAGAYSNTAEATTPLKGAAPVLSAAPYSESEIDLSWTHTQTDHTGFRIEWCKVVPLSIDCTQDSHFTPNAPVEKAAGAATHRHSGLEIGATYTYRMVAYKSASCGWTTNYSAPVAAATIAPPAPSDLRAIPANTTRVDLTWNDNTGAETGFTVQRCEVTGGVDCTQDAQFSTIASPGANGTSTVTIQDTGVCTGKTYRYRVRANNAAWPGGSTAWSNVAPAVMPAIGNILLDADFENTTTNWTGTAGTLTGVSFDTATVYSGITSLKLDATGAVLGRMQTVTVKPLRQYILSGYLNTALTAGTAQCDVQGTGIASLGIVSTGNSGGWTSLLTETVTIPAGTSAVNIRCFADESPQGTAYIDVVQLVPVPIVSLTATRISETQIDLAWDDNMSDKTGFDVLWCSGSAGCSPATSLVSGITTTTRSHTGLTPSTTYRYLVRGYKTASGCTGGRWTTDSNIAEAATTVLPPSSLVANTVNTTRIDVSWTDSTASESRFNIYRCEDTGGGCTPSEPLVGTVAGNGTIGTTVTYQDTGVCNSKTYVYQVKAEKTSAPTWLTDPSNAASAMTLTPTAPSSPSASAVTDTRIDVSWTDATTDETGFKIEKCVEGVCDPLPIDVDSASRNWTSTTGARTYSVSGLAASKNHCFRVKAYKTATCLGGWETAYTSQVCAQTFSAAPSGLIATPLNSLKIKLDWNDNSSDETGFELEVQAWNGKWALITTLGPGVKTYIDTEGLEPQKQYRYRVRAVRGADKSPYSNEATAVTPPYQQGDDTCR